MPLVRFISPTDPRRLSTLRAAERRLVDDAHVHRYEIVGTEVDGLAGTEGTFSICSFWYVECLSRAGDLQKARFIFEKMLGYANHLGLYAEELGRRGEHLGNFPQAFTHLALISAAYDLDRRLSGAGWRASDECTDSTEVKRWQQAALIWIRFASSSRVPPQAARNACNRARSGYNCDSA